MGGGGEREGKKKGGREGGRDKRKGGREEKRSSLDTNYFIISLISPLIFNPSSFKCSCMHRVLALSCMHHSTHSNMTSNMATLSAPSSGDPIKTISHMSGLLEIF